MKVFSITMLVNNVVTSSEEFFNNDHLDDYFEVMFILNSGEGSAVIRYTLNQMPILADDCKDEWLEQFKLVAQLANSYTLEGVGRTAKGFRNTKGFKGVCKLFYNA